MMQPKSVLRCWGLSALVVCLAVLVAPSPAVAAGPGDRVAYLNKKAMEDYDALEFESARKTLTDAIALLRKNGTDQTVQAARTYINLGMVYIALKDKSRGQQQFVKALIINPKAKLDPTLATPEMQLVWDSAVAQMNGSPPPSEPASAPTPTQNDTSLPGPATSPTPSVPATPNELPVTPTTPSKPTQPLEYNADELLDPVLKVELQHNAPDDARSNQKLTLYATTTAVHQGAVAARVSLFFRGAGQERYAEVTMQPSRRQQGEVVGQIPAESVSGKSLQYYISAFDAKGRVCGSQGSPDNPLIVRVTAGGPAVAQGTDGEDPIQYVKRADEERRLQSARDWVYFDLGVGSGGALIMPGTNAEVSYFYSRDDQAYVRSHAANNGFVWSGIGVRAELGVYLWRGLSLGVSARFEPYLNHNADSQVNALNNSSGCSTSPGNPCYSPTAKGQFGYAVLGKLRYQFRKNYGQYFRPYIHLDVGGGEWRGALNIEGSRPSDPNSPFQPTDVCSATYSGTPNNRMPPGCSSVNGGTMPGYNLRTNKDNAVPSGLNRVCPASGPCIDSVLLGKALVGGGAGFYLGNHRIGISVDFSVLAAVGGQFGLFLETYVGPQIMF